MQDDVACCREDLIQKDLAKNGKAYAERWPNGFVVYRSDGIAIFGFCSQAEREKYITNELVKEFQLTVLPL